MKRSVLASWSFYPSAVPDQAYAGTRSGDAAGAATGRALHVAAVRNASHSAKQYERSKLCARRHASSARWSHALWGAAAAGVGEGPSGEGDVMGYRDARAPVRFNRGCPAPTRANVVRCLVPFSEIAVRSALVVVVCLSRLPRRIVFVRCRSVAAELPTLSSAHAVESSDLLSSQPGKCCRVDSEMRTG